MEDIMKKILLCTLVLTPTVAVAQETGSVQAYDEGAKPKPSHYHSPGLPPEKGKEIRKIAEDEPGKTQENFGVVSIHDNEPFFQVLGDRLEHRSDGNEQIVLWDMDAWYGTDYNKFYVESEGEWNTDKDEPENVSMEVFWNHTFRPFWDTQLGIRHDILDGKDDRTFLAGGIQGMAPYIFEVDATAYVSEDGDTSAVFEVERDFYFTQRLVLQPRLETEVAFSDVSEYNIAAGFTSIETGLRIRYEFTRKFAPYIGVSWERSLGKTADMRQADGEDINKTNFVAGVKFWF
jgi:copper resistance protein B